jgi:hypothetical protein
MKKKGNVSLYFAFVAVAVIVILIAGLVAPIGSLFSIQMFEAGEDILIQANSTADGLSSAGVRDAWKGSLQSAVDATDNNVEVTTGLFKYAWIFIVVISGIIVFLAARFLVEVGRSGSGLS